MMRTLPERRRAASRHRAEVPGAAERGFSRALQERSPRIPSLREYVLVPRDSPRVEVFRRTERGTWELFAAAAGEAITLASLDARLEVDALDRDPLAEPAASQSGIV